MREVSRKQRNHLSTASQADSSSTTQPFAVTPVANVSDGHSLAAISLAPVQRRSQEEALEQLPDVPVAQTGGQTLPRPLKLKMEQAFGADFSDVRVHEGPEAKQLGAVAYARGSHLHFQPGRYQPESPKGQELLGHELAHVVQQRTGKVSVPQSQGAPINADRSLEAEADRLGQKAASGQNVVSGLANRGMSQPNAPAIQRNKTDADLEEEEGITSLGGGTKNAVYKTKYRNEIDNSGVRTGYFKPGVTDPDDLPDVAHAMRLGRNGAALNTPGRAVASYQMSKHMGLGIIPAEVRANHTPPGAAAPVAGSVSAEVPNSKPLFTHRFDLPATPEQIAAHQQEPSQNLKQEPNGAWMQKTGTRFNQMDFRQPWLQKGMSDLQLFDALVGQGDRHGGNIMVNEQAQTVRGIDNDMAFGQGRFAQLHPNKQEIEGIRGTGHNLGLPDLVDHETAKKFKKMKPADVTRIMQDSGLTAPQEIEAAHQRLGAIHGHIKNLKKNNQLVGQKPLLGKAANPAWGDATYNQAMAYTPDKQAGKNFMGSYLQQAATNYQNAAGQVPAGLGEHTNIAEGTPGAQQYNALLHQARNPVPAAPLRARADARADVERGRADARAEDAGPPDLAALLLGPPPAAAPPPVPWAGLPAPRLGAPGAGARLRMGHRGAAAPDLGGLAPALPALPPLPGPIPDEAAPDLGALPPPPAAVPEDAGPALPPLPGPVQEDIAPPLPALPPLPGLMAPGGARPGGWVRPGGPNPDAVRMRPRLRIPAGEAPAALRLGGPLLPAPEELEELGV